MSGDQQFGRSSLDEGVYVDHHRGDHEWHGHHQRLAQGESPSPGEVAGQEGQHEQARISQQPRCLFGREPGRHTCDLDRGGRRDGEHECLQPPTVGLLLLTAVGNDELSPQPGAVLAGELAGQLVDCPHPLHRHQERLVGREADLRQISDLSAEMVLQLLQVAAIDRRALFDEGTPLLDLQLQLVHAHALPKAKGSRSPPPQASPRAFATVTHCRLCSASAACPSSVIA